MGTYSNDSHTSYIKYINRDRGLGTKRGSVLIIGFTGPMFSCLAHTHKNNMYDCVSYVGSNKRLCNAGVQSRFYIIILHII